MAFIVGNVSDSLYPASVKTALANDNSPVYGVKWTDAVPQRIYDAQDKVIELSSDTVKGRDDFENLPPFNVKECITRFNTGLGKREVLAYKGDPDWDNLVTQKVGDRVIEFPCFWYKRIGSDHILISPAAKDGFKPSPAHFRKGVLYDKLRISKYVIPSFDSDIGVSNHVLVSASNSRISDQNTLRNIVRDKGAFLFDFPCVGMLQMLGLVKYAQPNFSALFTPGKLNTAIINGVTDTILGLDGKVQDYNCMFGLENISAYRNLVVDGFYCIGLPIGSSYFGSGFNFYYRDGTEIASTPTSVSEVITFSTKLGNTYTSIASGDVVVAFGLYDDCDWAWLPKANSSSIIGQTILSAHTSQNFLTVMTLSDYGLFTVFSQGFPYLDINPVGFRFFEFE